MILHRILRLLAGLIPWSAPSDCPAGIRISADSEPADRFFLTQLTDRRFAVACHDLLYPDIVWFFYCDSPEDQAALFCQLLGSGTGRVPDASGDARVFADNATNILHWE